MYPEEQKHRRKLFLQTMQMTPEVEKSFGGLHDSFENVLRDLQSNIVGFHEKSINDPT